MNKVPEHEHTTNDIADFNNLMVFVIVLILGISFIVILLMTSKRMNDQDIKISEYEKNLTEMQNNLTEMQKFIEFQRTLNTDIINWFRENSVVIEENTGIIDCYLRTNYGYDCKNITKQTHVIKGINISTERFFK